MTPLEVAERTLEALGLAQYAEELPSALWDELDLFSQGVVQCIVGVLLIAVALTALALVRWVWYVAWIAILRLELRLMKLDSLPLEERTRRLKWMTLPAPSLRWAVKKLERLRTLSITRGTEEVIDLAVARFQSAGFLMMFPRVLILLGLLGTLWGLVTAVQNVYIRIQDLQDLNSLYEPLGKTLEGLGGAFITTLAGVGAVVLLTPALAVKKLSDLYLMRSVDAILVEGIAPLIALEPESSAEGLRRMAREVSKEVVTEIVGDTVRETSAGLNNLSNALLEAVQTTDSQRCDIVSVVDNLDTATAGISDLTAATARAVSHLEAKIGELSTTFVSLTPASQLRSEVIEHVAQAVGEQLTGLTLQLRRQEESQQQGLRLLKLALEHIDTSLGRTRDSLEARMATLADLPPITEGAAEKLARVLGETAGQITEAIQVLEAQVKRLEEAGEAPPWLGPSLAPLAGHLEQLSRDLGPAVQVATGGDGPLAQLVIQNRETQETMSSLVTLAREQNETLGNWVARQEEKAGDDGRGQADEGGGEVLRELLEQAMQANTLLTSLSEREMLDPVTMMPGMAPPVTPSVETEEATDPPKKEPAKGPEALEPPTGQEVPDGSTVAPLVSAVESQTRIVHHFYAKTLPVLERISRQLDGVEKPGREPVQSPQPPQPQPPADETRRRRVETPGQTVQDTTSPAQDPPRRKWSWRFGRR